MDHTMVLSYDCSNQNRRQRRTNAPPLRAILMAMAVRRCNMEGIAKCSVTRASLEATGRRHRATTSSVSPWRPPGRQSTQWWCNMYPICWPFRWSSRRALVRVVWHWWALLLLGVTGGGVWLQAKGRMVLCIPAIDLLDALLPLA